MEKKSRKLIFCFKKVAWKCPESKPMIIYHSLNRLLFFQFKMGSGGHLGFVEFLYFDQCNTETRVKRLIPLVLGQWIRFWCSNYDFASWCKFQICRQNDKFVLRKHYIWNIASYDPPTPSSTHTPHLTTHLIHPTSPQPTPPNPHPHPQITGYWQCSHRSDTMLKWSKSLQQWTRAVYNIHKRYNQGKIISLYTILRWLHITQMLKNKWLHDFINIVTNKWLLLDIIIDKCGTSFANKM